MGTLVKLENVSKVYVKNKILKDISLTINENQVIAFLGGNGTGKSTILRIIAGLERPSSGKVIYPDKSMRIGYVPERFPKLLRFTPSEYLHYIGQIGGIPKEYLNGRISALLHRFQLEEVNDDWIMDLSKGNIQKVGIIQAVLQENKLLILDEPLSGLDYDAQKELLTILQELKNDGTTILLSYHESHIFGELIDNTYFLNQGLISKGNPSRHTEMKLLTVNHIDESVVRKWEEVLRIKRADNGLLLYVDPKNSDIILARVLQLRGSIEYVSTEVGSWEGLNC